ncbi:MAG: helix-turn-helix transcriptional regulator [Pseudobdellovibrio sp.]
MNLLDKAFGVLLKGYRERKDLTQTELAALLEISRATIVYYEKGEQSPSLDILIKVNKHLKIDLQAIQNKYLELENESGMNTVPKKQRALIEESLEKLFSGKKD